jgi:hypothetical protein
MAPGPTWIERGADGRPYFVRKKSKVPSARELLSDALGPLKKRSSPFSRAFHRDHLIVPAPFTTVTPTPLYLPAPPLPPASSTPDLPPNNGKPPSGPNAAAMDPAAYNNLLRSQGLQFQQPGINPPRGILKPPQPPTYPVPDPMMYPNPPQPPQNRQQNQQAGYGTLPQHPSTQQLQNIPTQPPGAYPTEPLPPGARIISPPRYPTADDLRYKCSNCGRFRSQRYHFEHPLPLGQLPPRTICGKCRDEAEGSDSEGTATSDEYNDSRRRRPTARTRSRSHNRGRSRSRSRARSATPAPRRSTRRRSISRSRAQWSDDDDEKIGEIRRSYSRSSSLEMEPSSSRRPAPQVEIFRYVERPARPQLTRRIVYVEDERPRRSRDYDWEDEEEDDGREYRTSYRYLLSLNLPHQLISPRSRRYSRPSTPAPRIVRRQSSDPSLYEPLAIEHRRYDDHDDDYQRFLRPPSRRPSHMRVTSNPHPCREVRYSSENDATCYEQAPRASTRRPRSVVVRSRGRSRDRPESLEYGKVVPHQIGQH